MLQDDTSIEHKTVDGQDMLTSKNACSDLTLSPIYLSFKDSNDHKKVLKVTQEMYTWSNPDQKECFIGIAKSKEFSENIKLGTVFISNYHTILNFKDKSVSFAPKVKAPKEQKID